MLIPNELEHIAMTLVIDTVMIFALNMVFTNTHTIYRNNTHSRMN